MHSRLIPAGSVQLVMLKVGVIGSNMKSSLIVGLIEAVKELLVDLFIPEEDSDVEDSDRDNSEDN
jgi:hypothetical protein